MEKRMFSSFKYKHSLVLLHSFLTSVFLQVLKRFMKTRGFTRSFDNKEDIRKH